MEKNSTILGKYYLEGTTDLAQRLPNPEQSTVASIAKAMFAPMNNKIYNDFADFMVNRVGFSYVHSKRYTNDLKEYEKQKLWFGNSVTETALNWVKAHTYDVDAEEQFKTFYPDGLQAFHSEPLERWYPISISRDQLARSFVDEYGLNKYIAAQTDTAINSDEYDNYLLMLGLFKTADVEYNLYRHHVEAAPTTKETCEEMLVAMQQLAYDFTAPSSIYTQTDIPVFATKDEITAFIRSDVMAQTNVKALAAAFNLDYEQVPFRIKVVPKALWPLNETDYAVLTTSDFFQVYPVVYETTSQWDAVGRKTNYYLHDWRIVAFSPFAPCSVISSDAGTATPSVKLATTGLELAAASDTAKPGDIVQLTATLNGTLTPADAHGVIEVAPDAALFTVSAADADGAQVALNSRTYVDRLGRLHIQKTGLAATNKITVSATSVYTNPNGATTPYTATAEITIS